MSAIDIKDYVPIKEDFKYYLGYVPLCLPLDIKCSFREAKHWAWVLGVENTLITIEYSKLLVKMNEMLLMKSLGTINPMKQDRALNYYSSIKEYKTVQDTTIVTAEKFSWTTLQDFLIMMHIMDLHHGKVILNGVYSA